MASAVLITGVGRRRGIGASIAAGLATDGWDLVLSYWHPYDDRVGHEYGADDPEEVARELRQAGRTVELLPADLDDPETPQTLVHRAAESVGPLDALVMAHCESVDSGLLDMTVESLIATMPSMCELDGYSSARLPDNSVRAVDPLSHSQAITRSGTSPTALPRAPWTALC